MYEHDSEILLQAALAVLPVFVRAAAPTDRWDAPTLAFDQAEAFLGEFRCRQDRERCKRELIARSLERKRRQEADAAQKVK